VPGWLVQRRRADVGSLPLALVVIEAWSLKGFHLLLHGGRVVDGCVQGPESAPAATRILIGAGAYQNPCAWHFARQESAGGWTLEGLEPSSRIC
jgi:hypothetical protein